MNLNLGRKELGMWPLCVRSPCTKAKPAGAEASFHSFGGFCGEKERIPLLKQPIDTLLVFLAIFR